MYHPAMTALKWIIAAALVAMLALPAHADVSGPACVKAIEELQSEERPSDEKVH